MAGVVVVVVLALLLSPALAGGTAHGPADRAAAAEAVPQQLLDGLRELDIEINDLIRKLENDQISGGVLSSAISDLIQRKHALLASFPPVFGIPFRDVYDDLYCFHQALEQADGAARSNPGDKKTVIRWLIKAKKCKRHLEDRLEASKQAPKVLFTDLRYIDQRLNEFVLDIDEGKNPRFVLLSLDYLETLLYNDLRDFFSPVFGVSFADIYQELRSVDDLLQEARADVTRTGVTWRPSTREAVIKTLLEAARAHKQRLERELRAAACTRGRDLAVAGRRARGDRKRPCPPPPPRQTLTVTKAGTGSGAITSSPAGIDCGSTCSARFRSGMSVTLTAAPAPDSDFSGFSGDCSGSSCTVKMTTAHNVTASFVLKRFQLQVTTQGQGGVQAGVQGQQPVINCPPNSTPQTQGCSASFDAGTKLTLLAIPAGRPFAGWLGDCTGTQNPCQLTMDANKSVTANFP